MELFVNFLLISLNHLWKWKTLSMKHFSKTAVNIILKYCETFKWIKTKSVLSVWFSYSFHLAYFFLVAENFKNLILTKSNSSFSHHNYKRNKLWVFSPLFVVWFSKPQWHFFSYSIHSFSNISHFRLTLLFITFHTFFFVLFMAEEKEIAESKWLPEDLNV